MAKNIAKALRIYAELKVETEARVKEDKAWADEQKSKMERLQMYIKGALNEAGSDSVTANGMTAFKKTNDFVGIEDKNAISIFIVQEMLLHLQSHMYRGTDGEWLPDGKDCLKENVESALSTGVFDLLSLKAHKNNCKEYSKSHDGLFPIGIKYTTEDVVQVRKSTRKEK